ncbi:ATP-binding protein [Streptomyces sp. NPDC000987]|uniref:ATP-binding protein n=1 Tax=Streptomyces sp. NPDC000987 TaxID=3154374 RepID=UPI003323A183
MTVPADPTDQMVPLLDAVLRQWPGRCRHPGLAVALTGGRPLGPEQAAELVLRGLAEPMTEAEGLHRLVEEGEFTAAAELLDTADRPDGPVGTAMPRDVRAELEARLDAAQQEALTTVRSRVSLLRRRAARGSTALPPSLAERAEEAALRRRAEATALLDEAEAAVHRAEQRQQQELHSELGAADLSEAHAAAVLACLEANEFEAARRLLTAEDIDMNGSSPAWVPRPPRWDAMLGRTLQEILSHYPPDSVPPRHDYLNRFVRLGESDVPLLQSLRKLASARHETSVADFASCLSAMLGEDVRKPVTFRDAGFHTLLTGLDDARLPHLPITDPGGVHLWVSATDAPPPEALTRPLVWFVPTAGPAPATPAGVAALTAVELLRVLAPPPAGLLSAPAHRRINLLRVLVPRLGPCALAFPGAGIALNGSTPREALAWLLDLHAVVPDAAVVHALDYESEGHPLVLRMLLEEVLPQRSADGRLNHTGLARVRTPEFRARTRSAVADGLPAEERAALGMAYALHHEGPFRGGDILADLPLAGLPDDFSRRSGQLFDAEEVLDRLCRHGLLRQQTLRDGTSGYRTLRAGLGALLAEGAAEQAGAAVETLLQRLEEARAFNRAAHTEKAVRHHAHQADNDLAVILERLSALGAKLEGADAAEMNQVMQMLPRLGGEQIRTAVSGYQAPPAVHDIGELLHAVTRDVEFNEGVRITFRTELPDGAPVLAVRTGLQTAFENLIRNAAQAVRSLRAGPSADAVRNGPDIVVRLGPGEADRGPTGPAGWFQVDIEDAGPGLSDGERELLRTGEHLSRHGTGGTGLAAARGLVRDAGGRVDILDRSGLGGAHLRVRLPAAEDGSSGGTPEAVG